VLRPWAVLRVGEVGRDGGREFAREWARVSRDESFETADPI